MWDRVTLENGGMVEIADQDGGGLLEDVEYGSGTGEFYSSAFLRSRDSWRIVNFGSEYSEGGNCMGLAATSILTFQDVKFPLSKDKPVPYMLKDNEALIKSDIQGWTPSDRDWFKDVISLSELEDTPRDAEALKLIGNYHLDFNDKYSLDDVSWMNKPASEIVSMIKQNPFLIVIGNNEGAHAIVGYAARQGVDGNPRMTAIYCYDSNLPNRECVLYIAEQDGPTPSGTSWNSVVYYDAWDGYVWTSIQHINSEKSFNHITGLYDEYNPDFK